MTFDTYVYSREPSPNPKSQLLESIGAHYISSETIAPEMLPHQIGNIDLVYEATGASSLSFEMMKYLGTNGIFIFTGVPGRKGPIEVDTDLMMRNLVLKNQVIFGTVNAGRDSFENSIRRRRHFYQALAEAVKSLISGPLSHGRIRRSPSRPVRRHQERNSAELIHSPLDHKVFWNGASTAETLIELYLRATMTDALKQHWPEYLMEGTCLGLFMISAFTFGTILEHPASPIHQAIPNPLLRRFLMGLAMGLTAISIIYSPWGKQSGAHINPSTTFTFFRLGKVATWDAVFYIVSQFVGGLAGALLAATLLSRWVSHPSVNYVTTRPGMAGISAAFFGRGCNYLHSYVGDLESLEPRALAQIDRPLRRCAGRHLYNDRSANFRYEHESRADFCIGGSSPSLARPMGLFHRASRRHVVCRGSLCADPRRPERRLRQAPSRK